MPSCQARHSGFSKTPNNRATISAIIRFGFICALAFPSNLCALNFNSPYLQNLSDLDSFVSSSYNALSNSAIIYPDGQFTFGVAYGVVPFANGSDLASLSNSFPVTTMLGVPVYTIVVVETQSTPRVWLYEGTNGVPFRTNNVPADFDPQAWVRAVYQANPPTYLAGADLAQWYADKDRSRLILVISLINSNNWDALLTAQQAAASTNMTSGLPPPVLPLDTNTLAIVGLQMGSAGTMMGMWFYTPRNAPIAILSRPLLSATTNGWNVVGTINAVTPFEFWQVPIGEGMAFYRPGYLDADTDGDGLPDLLETYVYGTNPNNADSDGDGIGDYNEIFVYYTDPNNPDTTKPTITLSCPVNNYNFVWTP